MATAQAELIDQLQNGTSGTLTNQTVADMQLIGSHSWSGSFLGLGPPTTIPTRGVSRFTHLKGGDKGSKAAVIYTITTPAGLPGAVILGWCAPAYFNPSTSPNKVFGAVGPRAVIESMSFDQIQMLVDKAGSSVEVNRDGVCMHATILNNPIANMADLLASFSYLCPKP